MRTSLASQLIVAFAAAAALLALPGCDTIYYKTMKKFGVEKRDILVTRVRDAREAQQKGKEEFRSALERFKSVVETDGGTLDEKYNKLNKELERSEDRAKDQAQPQCIGDWRARPGTGRVADRRRCARRRFGVVDRRG